MRYIDGRLDLEDGRDVVAILLVILLLPFIWLWGLTGRRCRRPK